MQKYIDLISQMTLEEKAGLCSGKDFWHLKGIKRLGIPEIMVCDGPHGLRKQNSENKEIGIGNSYPATCFPTAVTTACSWDRDLIRRMGVALAEECLAEEVSVLLGPGTNIKRSPLCGRNFEYFSEDPELAGTMAAGFIDGVQSLGVGTSLKHFAGNSQEKRRMTSNSIIDERALREIYLRAFEIAVTSSQPYTVMCAYNLLNGAYCSENRHLQREILRNTWGFEGIVVSDWGAVNNRVEGLENGNDLEMPSSGGINDAKIVEAVRTGVLDEAVLDETVDKILDLIFKAKKVRSDKYTYDKTAHNNLAREIARQSMVLLKNEENILPIKRKEGTYTAIIGDFAYMPRYQGAGSSVINPTMIDESMKAFRNSPIDVKFARGYSRKKNDRNNPSLIAEACALAGNAENVVVFIGLTDDYESEGFDRRNMKLPDVQNTLIKALKKVNDNIIVVLQGGSPVEMPWINDVKAVLNAYLGGQAVNSAVVDVLTGKSNPCGKLAETYPLSLEDTPTAGVYPCDDINILYRESIFVGYRYYEKTGKNVLFPFGYGLSYTTFEYSDMTISKESLNKGDGLSISVKVKNTGSTAGSEIVQIYVSKPESRAYRAVKELKAFTKIRLEPGEEKTVSVELSDRAFCFWNVKTGSWCCESGEYIISACASSADERCKAAVSVTSQDDETIVDMRDTVPSYYNGDPAKADDSEFRAVYGSELPLIDVPSGKSLNVTIEAGRDKGLSKVIYKGLDMVTKPAGGLESSMILNTVMETPVRNYVAMSGGLFTEDMADGLLSLFEGKNVGKGIGKIAKGVPHVLVNLKDLLKSI